MKVGDYVRTKKGEIGKIIGYVDEPTDYYFNCYVTTLKTNFTDTYITEYDNNIKSSPNIIDLIEVGDYVNGEKVIRLFNPTFLSIGELPYVITDKSKYEPQEIENIVTKEQFEAMKYEIK